MIPPEKRWYVVQTKPHQEQAARDHLARRGVDTFFPRLRLPRYVRNTQPIVPLFPGYGFVHLVLDEQFDRVRWSPGVRRFINAGGEPAALDEAVMDFLRRNASGEGVIEARPHLEVGDNVRIKGGPFDGLAAVIQRPPDGRGRVKVLMRMLTGHVVAARLPVHQVAGGWLA